MEKFYKQARVIAVCYLIVASIGWLIDVTSIFSFAALFKVQVCSNECWTMSYNWVGGLVGLSELLLLVFFFGKLFNVSGLGTTNRKASLLALIGVGLLCVNNIAYATEFFLADGQYSIMTAILFQKIRFLAAFYPSRIILAIAVLLIVRSLPRSSVAFFGGLSYFVYGTLVVLYSSTLLFFGEQVFGSFDKFWYSSATNIIAFLSDVALVVFLFSYSRGQFAVSESKETETLGQDQTEHPASPSQEESQPDSSAEKSSFFLKRWLAGGVDAVDRVLFKTTEEQGATMGLLFWILFIIGFVAGGVSIVVSFFDLNFPMEKTVAVVALFALAPLVWYMVFSVSQFNGALIRLLRLLYIVVACAIGLGFGYLLGMIVVAVVIFIVCVFLLLKIIAAGASGSGSSNSDSSSSSSGPKPPEYDIYAKEGDVKYHDGAKWEHDGSWGDPWRRV